jgi:predicted site-specific integrase-resolvase
MEHVVCRKAAKILGVHPNTLRKWANAGKIKYIKSASGQRRYDVDDYLGIQKKAKIICYCRVSSYKQKDDLARQVEFMRGKYPAAQIVKDIGSGINFKRKGLFAILDAAIDGDKLEVVVAYRDRLARFGIDLIRWIIEKSGGRLVVLNQIDLSPEQELTQDLLTILHVFSCRMHGLRSYKNKIAKDFPHGRSKKVIQNVD